MARRLDGIALCRRACYCSELWGHDAPVTRVGVGQGFGPVAGRGIYQYHPDSKWKGSTSGLAFIFIVVIIIISARSIYRRQLELASVHCVLHIARWTAMWD